MILPIMALFGPAPEEPSHEKVLMQPLFGIQRVLLRRKGMPVAESFLFSSFVFQSPVVWAASASFAIGMARVSTCAHG